VIASALIWRNDVRLARTPSLTSFAQVTGAALRSPQTREERERRIQRLSALNVLAWQLAGVHEPYEIARLAYDAAGELVARDAFYVARFDADKREFDFVLQADGDDVWRDERYPLGTGPTSQVVLLGETHLVGNPEDPTQLRGMTFGEAARASGSAAHVPLKSRGRLIGVLSSSSPPPRTRTGGSSRSCSAWRPRSARCSTSTSSRGGSCAFGRDDEELLTAVSHQVAAALRVAKLHQAAKLAAATDPLTSLPNRRTFFERLLRELATDPAAPVSVAVLDVNGLNARNDGLDPLPERDAAGRGEDPGAREHRVAARPRRGRGAGRSAVPVSLTAPAPTGRTPSPHRERRRVTGWKRAAARGLGKSPASRSARPVRGANEARQSGARSLGGTTALFVPGRTALFVCPRSEGGD